MIELSQEILEERDRVVGLLNLAAILMPAGDPYYSDLIQALKACVRNDKLLLDYTIEQERQHGKIRRGY